MGGRGQQRRCVRRACKRCRDGGTGCHQLGDVRAVRQGLHDRHRAGRERNAVQVRCARHRVQPPHACVFTCTSGALPVRKHLFCQRDEHSGRQRHGNVPTGLWCAAVGRRHAYATARVLDLAHHCLWLTEFGARRSQRVRSALGVAVRTSARQEPVVHQAAHVHLANGQRAQGRVPAKVYDCANAATHLTRCGGRAGRRLDCAWQHNGCDCVQVFRRRRTRSARTGRESTRARHVSQRD